MFFYCFMQVVLVTLTILLCVMLTNNLGDEIMIVNADENGKVNWFNEYITLDEAGKWFNEHTFWTDATVPEPEEQTGKAAVLYWENNMLVWKYEDEPEPEPTPEPQPTQLDTIEEGQLIIMEAMADQYEQSVETELTNMEVMATIYEQLLAMEGVE